MLKKIFVCLIVLLLVAVPAGANMVADGGFENPHFDGQSYETYTDGPTIGAWTVIGGADSIGVLLGYDTINTPPRMWDMNIPEGTQFFLIGEAVRENSIIQTITGFDIGAAYEISMAAINWDTIYLNNCFIQVYNAAADSYDLDDVFHGSIRTAEV